MARILLVDDEPSLQLALGDALRDDGFDVTLAGTLREALGGVDGALPDLVLCDLRLPDGSGLDVLRAVQSASPELPVIMLTAFGTIPGAVEALRAGAAEFLTKPFDEAQLVAMIRRHLELARLRRRVEELEGVSRVPLGADPAFCRVVDLARTVAASDITVLLLGETGTGKEVLARYVHECSRRRAQAFVAVNCAALPESLLEAELFGHERGAFTGAVRQRRGRFEEAHRGTLLLDEVAETSPAVQAKLLRALEQQQFERLGSSTSIQVDVRIVAATRRDLAAEVAAGRFRDDLYYRLKVVPLALPPLRDRPADIPLLAQAFARRIGSAQGRAFAFAPEALECLARHPWPGNVRELQHLAQRLAAVSTADVVRPEHLPAEYRDCARVDVGQGPTAFRGTLAEMVGQFEQEILRQMLARFHGHRGRIAQALGISRKNLWEKLRAHGLGDGDATER